MELSNRLKAVVKMVPSGKKVADIGCDHGYVAIHVLRERQARHVIAMDINKGPLLRAEENIKRSAVDVNCIETRLSNGAEKLQNKEVDVMVLTGMGGRLICSILDDAAKHLEPCEYLVLSPQSDLDMVRKYLREHNYRIQDENFLKEEEKFYSIILAVRGEFNTTKKICELQQRAEDLFGPILLSEKSEVFLQYLNKEKNTTIHIMEKVHNEQRLSELKSYLSCINFALEE